MTLTGSLNDMSSGALDTVGSLVAGDFGTIIVTLLALSILYIIVTKIRQAFGVGR